MKRLISILLLFCFCAALFGCAKRPAEQGEASVPTEAHPAVTDKADATEAAAVTEAPEITEAPAPTPKTDDKFYVIDRSAQRMNTLASVIFETDDGVYYLATKVDELKDTKYNLIYYSDKEYKSWMPLCGKPNCLHNDSSCNAVLESEIWEIWLYGRHIYYAFENKDADEEAHGVQLWRMKLDGSDHEKVTVIDPENDYDDLPTLRSWSCTFHNRYLFLCGRHITRDEVSGDLSAEFYNFVVDLDDPNAAPRRLNILIDGSYTLDNFALLESRGNDLIALFGDEEGKHYYRCDLETMTGTELCTLPNIIYLTALHLYDGQLWFPAGYELGKIFAVDIETGEVETVASAEPKEMLWYNPWDGYIVGANFGEGTPQGTGIYDMNGNLLEFIEQSEYNAKIMVSFIIGHTVYGHTYTGADYIVINPPDFYLDLDELGTENFGWHKWEP